VSALVTVGIVCLYLSDAVARHGSWWQNTLDAFGVGFVVGGIVDVTAISLLNRSLGGAADPKRKMWNDRARRFLASFSYVLDDGVVIVDQLQKAAREYADVLEPNSDWIDPYVLVRVKAVADAIRAITEGEPGQWAVPDPQGNAVIYRRRRGSDGKGGAAGPY
jgi:hypothetical protein